jgi:hypothetical protein
MPRHEICTMPQLKLTTGLEKVELLSERNGIIVRGLNRSNDLVWLRESANFAEAKAKNVSLCWTQSAHFWRRESCARVRRLAGRIMRLIGSAREDERKIRRQKSKVTIEIGVNGFELHNYHYTLSRRCVFFSCSLCASGPSTESPSAMQVECTRPVLDSAAARARQRHHQHRTARDPSNCLRWLIIPNAALLIPISLKFKCFKWAAQASIVCVLSVSFICANKRQLHQPKLFQTADALANKFAARKLNVFLDLIVHWL